MSTTFPSDLTDAQWRLIERVLPKAKSGTPKGGRPREVDLRGAASGRRSRAKEKPGHVRNRVKLPELDSNQQPTD